ncbi:aromatic ring-hydroxylating oxygenase subunit alpha [Halorientalis pallida]|uniref:Aromatic ring-hydroxylating dioxygenase subunit alpha n=1 Tax=Halorientalis pallida TaxID=2479928 RepID=A0A498KTI5_9EURY|nr:aromatic ring-hydroxylating dioxygenase subunit alpha [Halorientalis pallida]RXK47966.1 aromatic ring-hydroxylating dioxygenase subunit alpha [Halorientalis pallida]
MATERSDPDRTDRLVERTESGLDSGRFPMEIINDEEVYQAELRRVFARAWVYLGHTSEFEEPGDYARRYIGEDPFIVTRDENGEMHAFLDSCMHRGAQFCTAETGNTSHFRCPYHGWTYKNDGTLQGMPHMNEAYQELDEEEIELQEANLATYHGLIFGRIADEGPSLTEYLGDFTWYLDVLFNATEGGLTVVGEPHRWEADYDWKTAADNFSGDSYHVLTTHQASLETKELELGPWEELDDYLEAAYLSCTDSHCAAYYLSEDPDTHMGYPDGIEESMHEDLTPEQRELFARSVFHFGTIFPNTSYIHGIQSGGWGGPWVCLRKWQPRGCGKTETISWWLVPEEFADDESFLDDSHSGWNSLSPAGAFESDDLTVWEGISESSGALTHELRETEGNMQQGMGGMTDLTETVDDPVYGPAETTWQGGYFDERNSRMFYQAWCEMMSGAANPEGER